MAFFESKPFEVGSTFGNSAAATAGSADNAIEGVECWVEDKDVADTGRRSNRLRLLRVVRNVCTIGSGGESANGNLLPKRLVTFQASNWGVRVDGYAASRAFNQCFPVDEYLVSTGVAPNDLFYIVLKGPATVTSNPAGPTANIAVGDRLVNKTAANSGADTNAGKIDSPNYNVATTTLALEITNYIGRAMAALTTSQTNTDLLVDIQA